MPSLSFCLVTTFYPPASFGGDGVHVQQLARGLARRGHRVRVVHNPAAYRLLGGVEDPSEPPGDEGVEVVPSPAGPAATTVSYLTGVPLGYRRALQRLVGGFDVVHFHNPSLLGGPGAFDLGDGLRLYTTHEHWLLCPTHVLYRYGREVCSRRTCFTCTLSYHRPPQPWRSTGLLDRAVGHLDALLCPSRFTASLHHGRFPTARVEVLPLPGPEPVTSPSILAAPVDANVPFFLYSGRLEAIKGVSRLVGAFSRVNGARLVIAGDGKQRRRLERQAGASPAIQLLGNVAHDTVLGLCRAARAVVVPSVGYETFGRAAVEAMSMGTPVVVRAVGPLPELVEDGGGIAFADDDELAGVLQRLVDDREEADRLGADALRAAATRFDPDLFFDRYLDIVARLASETGHPIS